MHTRQSPAAAAFSIVAVSLVSSIVAPAAWAQLGAVLEREQIISSTSATAAAPAAATGAYAGTFVLGDNIKLQLRNETAGAYSGALTTPKGRYKVVAAAASSNRLVGRIDSGNTAGDYAEFTAHLDGDSFEMTLNGKVYVLDRAASDDPKRNARQTASTRQPQQEQPPQQEQQQRQIDRRLVGRWLSEDIYLSGDFSYSSQTWCILKSDGTYEYFSGGSGASSNAGTITRSGSRKNAITGIWRTENGSLYTQAKGSTNWGCVGQYSFDGEGNTVLVRSGNGKVLWERR
jgi:hypothetical protein